MNIKRILGSVLFLAFFSLIFIWADSYSKRPYPLSSNRVVISDTNVSIHIPVDFFYIQSGLYIFEDPYKTFPTPFPLWKDLTIQTFTPDPYHGYQTPERVMKNFFKGEVPEKQTINEFEIYLLRQDRESHPETFILKGLILYGEEQYISVNFRGPSSEYTQMVALLDAVLNSMQIEEE